MSPPNELQLGSNKQYEIVLKALNLTEQDFEKDIDTVEEWVKNQKHLPEITSRNRIRFFLTMNKGSIEIAKKCIDMYYTVMSIFPELYEDKHPSLAHIQEANNAISWLPLPKTTDDGYRVCIHRVTNADAVNLTNHFKTNLNIQEIRLAEDICVSDIYICDLGSFTASLVTKFTPTMLKKLAFVTSEVYSDRVHQVHFINSKNTYLVEVLLKVVKTFFNPKIKDRIFLHNDVNSIYEYVSKDILPKDYGGNEKSLDEINKMWMAKQLQYSERFYEIEKLRVNEDLRPEPLKNDEILGFYGNFKKLNLD